MSEKSIAAFGIFPDRVSLENVLACLKSEGFSSSEISVLFRENRGTWQSAPQKGSQASSASDTNAGRSASVHGALRWLAGIGAIAIPGKGTYVGVGPIKTALQATAFGGIHGPLAASLVGMGVPVNDAKRYEGRIVGSCFLLSVHSSDSERMLRAKRILEDTQAQDVFSTNESEMNFYGSGRSIPSGRATSGGEMSRSHYHR